MRLVIATLLLVSMSAHARGGLPDFSELTQENKPAVVNISTTRQMTDAGHMLPKGFELPEGAEKGPLGDLLRRFFDDPHSSPWGQRETRSLGSGFIISPDGYIITNHHVVADADEIIVRLNDRRQLEAELVGSDQSSDIALLKISADDLPVVDLGDSEDLEVGEWVLAIGSPFGFDYSVTAGIVSAKHRSLPNESYVPFIQTDVAINPGNSGGPLFNLDGEVVGVNSQIYSRTGGFMGLSFAVPIELALDVVDQIKSKGKVTRGWLGVLIQEVTRELAESFGMAKPQGALVSKVLPDSPAAEAGIKTGDVVLAFNGQPIHRASDLPPLVGKFQVGETARLKVLRDGRERTLEIKIGELPEDRQGGAPAGVEPDATEAPGEAKRLGLQVRAVSGRMRQRLEIEEGGVEVAQVKGPAAAAGLRPGDVITRVNNRPVEGVDDFMERIQAMEPGSSVALLVQRPDGPRYMALRIPEDDE
jgi:serine protease Do